MRVGILLKIVNESFKRNGLCDFNMDLDANASQQDINCCHKTNAMSRDGLVILARATCGQ